MNAGTSVAVLATPPGMPQPCAGNWKHGPYRETLALKDGRSVLLRPAHQRDAPALQRLFAELPPRSRLLRQRGDAAAAARLRRRDPQRRRRGAGAHPAALRP